MIHMFYGFVQNTTLPTIETFKHFGLFKLSGICQTLLLGALLLKLILAAGKYHF